MDLVKTLNTLAWIAAITGLVNFAILVAVGTKLQVAKEDLTKAAANAAANPFGFIAGLFKGS
jgi:hypothetical protein